MDACAKVYVKNVRLNVSNSELLLLKKKGRKAKFTERLPHILDDILQSVAIVSSLTFVVSKIWAEKNFFDEFSSDVQQMLFTFNDIN